MSQNKKSVWSAIILVTTILTLILLVAQIVSTTISLPVATEAARQAALDGGASPTDADLVATIAISAVIGALTVGSVFDVLRIVGGFLFSLKGRWGIFCIVVAIISVATGVWGLISTLTAAGGVKPVSLVLDILSLGVAVLFCVACFKHRAENQ